MYQVIPVQPKNTITAISVQKPGTMTLATIMMTYKNGTLFRISITRWNRRSNAPPQNPIAQPTAMPITKLHAKRIAANAKARRKPYTRRATTSRPVVSVPRK